MMRQNHFLILFRKTYTGTLLLGGEKGNKNLFRHPFCNTLAVIGDFNNRISMAIGSAARAEGNALPRSLDENSRPTRAFSADRQRP